MTNNHPSFKFLHHLDDDLKEILLKELKIMWTYTSNAIEGNTLTWGDTRFIIEEGLTISGKSIREHNEVIGHARAIDILYMMLDEDEILKENLFSLHKAVQTGIVVDVYCPVGGWKNEINGIYASINGERIFHRFCSAEDVEHLMGLWLEKFGKITRDLPIDPLIELYAKMHITFVSIHPFFDGNGRIARLISNLPLLKAGYPPIIIRKERRADYLRIIAHYSHLSAPLNSNTIDLLESKNQYVQEFVDFCMEEYKQTKELLKDVYDLQKERNLLK